MSSHEAEFDAMVVLRRSAADSIDIFELARVDGSTLPPWQAGAHLDLLLPSGDERQYSLLLPRTSSCDVLSCAVFVDGCVDLAHRDIA